jgi:hypothetical protein
MYMFKKFGISIANEINALLGFKRTTRQSLY